MLLVIAVLLTTGIVCFGACKLGRRSAIWPLVLSPPLLFAAWWLVNLKIPQGEGAASGVVVIQAGAWYFAALCALLAIILVATSFHLRRSPAAGVLLCVFVFIALALGYRVATSERATSTRREPVKPVAAPRASYVEGYTWAVDTGIDTVTLCVNGSPAFIDGCRHAARGRQRPK